MIVTVEIMNDAGSYEKYSVASPDRATMLHIIGRLRAVTPGVKAGHKVILTNIGPSKINVTKVVRELTDLGLKEAKEAKEIVEAMNGIVLCGVNKPTADAAAEALREVGAQVAIKVGR